MEFQRGIRNPSPARSIGARKLRHDPAKLHMARRLVAFHLAMFVWISRVCGW